MDRDEQKPLEARLSIVVSNLVFIGSECGQSRLRLRFLQALQRIGNREQFFGAIEGRHDDADHASVGRGTHSGIVSLDPRLHMCLFKLRDRQGSTMLTEIAQPV